MSRSVGKNRAARVAGALDFPDIGSTIALAQLPAGLLTADATGRAKVADKFLPFAKANVFISTEQTGTGAPQNVAHGLTGTPAGVLVCVTEHPGTPDTGAFDVEEGTHTGTNVVLTVTTGVKFKVLAWV